MTVVFVPLVLLYEGGIIISAVFGKTVIREQEKAEKLAAREGTGMDADSI
jgi:Sec-independent protein secretion pathway component TatC